VSDLLVEREEHVATITLNRPERMNAISGEMIGSLGRTLADANADPEVRVVVLTGAGRGFCAGLDLQDAGSDAGGAQLSSGAVAFDVRNSAPVVLREMDKPTVCALNGPAAGYGMDLALGCDVLIAAEGAKLAATPTRRGAIPESGGTWLLPKRLGWARAADVFFGARTLGADELVELGLALRVVPAEELGKAARALAGEYAANAPLAVQACKRLMRMGEEESFEAHVHHVLHQTFSLFRSEDFREGVTAWLERRAPAFRGR
jgi:enoyl-CoA hydratase/carnithine racemase